MVILINYFITYFVDILFKEQIQVICIRSNDNWIRTRRETVHKYIMQKSANESY